MVMKKMYYIRGYSYKSVTENSDCVINIWTYLIALKYVEYELRGFRIIKIK